MKKKFIALISAIIFGSMTLSQSVQVNAFMNETKSLIYENVQSQDINYNLALNKKAYSSGNETSSLSPEKAFDGNRASRDSRWSSSSFNENVGAWIYVDLEEVKEFKEFHLYWEAAAGKEYDIQISNDATNWETVSSITNGTEGKKVITLDKAVSSRYVRIFIKKHSPAVWHCVSLYEFEIYKETPPKDINDIAQDFTTQPTVSEDGKSIILPDAPEGFTLKLYGTDRAEVIDLNGNITTPLENVSINLLYELAYKDNMEKTAITKNIKIDIPGSHTPQDGENEKPFVIPSLREWAGDDGQYTLTDDSTIVVNPEYKDKLESSADITKKDLKDITGKDFNVEFGSPSEGDIYLTLNEEDSTLGKQGYELSIDDYITIIAPEETGVFYGTRSVLQILKQDEGKDNVPKGEARDYPKYGKRGFSLDVARKYFPLSYLEDTAKLMSWYKMNDFQIHLNDNAFPGMFGNDWSKVYTGFRIESETYPGLASEDGHYTKEEFKNFQKEFINYGINIIPELDTPAHSLAISHYMPEIASEEYGPDHLNLENSKTYEFVKNLFDEYISGDDPVFVGPDVHIGTDEYKGADQPTKELFRKYADDLINLVNDYGKDPMFWGSLTALNGETPVSNDATVACWYNGYADPIEMANQGYDLVSIPDGTVYIVPAAGYYYDYLNTSNLYNNWEPNKIGNVTFPYGFPQLKGGMFALWNDKYGNGISKHDCHDRIFPAVQTLSQKMWSGSDSKIDYSTFQTLSKKVGEAPNANISHKVEEELPNNEVIGIDFDNELTNKSDLDVTLEGKNITMNMDGRIGNSVKLNGGESYIETNMASLGFGWTMSTWINPSENNKNDAVIMESEEGTLKLRQGDTNKLGFSKENYNHHFNYVVPENKWTHITLTGDNKGTSLYVNGQFKERLEGNGIPGVTGGESSRYIQTFVLPLNYIGSKTNSFNGYLDDLKVYNRVLSNEEIVKLVGIEIEAPQENLALNKTATASSSEVSYLGPNQAIDGDKTSKNSRWSSNYKDNEWFQVDLGKIKEISSVKIFWQSAYATKYKILVSEDGENYTEVYNKDNGSGGTESLTFAPVNARYVKFQGIKRSSGYGYSFYEFEVYGSVSKKSLEDELIKAKAFLSTIVEGTENGQYLKGAKDKLTEIISNSEKVYNDPVATEYDIAFEVQSLKNQISISTKYLITDTTGDVNKDNLINISDLAIASKHYGNVDYTNSKSISSDINYDGKVDDYDLNFISSKILK